MVPIPLPTFYRKQYEEMDVEGNYVKVENRNVDWKGLAKGLAIGLGILMIPFFL